MTSTATGIGDVSFTQSQNHHELCWKPEIHGPCFSF